MEFLRQINAIVISAVAVLVTAGLAMLLLLSLGVKDFNLDGSEVLMFGFLSGTLIVAFFGCAWAMPVLLIGQAAEWLIRWSQHRKGTRIQSGPRRTRWMIGGCVGALLALGWLGFFLI